jgi:hypothetical protein
MMKVPPFSLIATLGHSGSQAEQPVHWEAMIFRAIAFSSLADAKLQSQSVGDLPSGLCHELALNGLQAHPEFMLRRR